MSYEVRDRLSFIVDIQKTGDFRAIDDFASRTQRAMNSATQSVGGFTQKTGRQLNTLDGYFGTTQTKITSFVTATDTNTKKLGNSFRDTFTGAGQQVTGFTKTLNEGKAGFEGYSRSSTTVLPSLNRFTTEVTKNKDAHDRQVRSIKGAMETMTPYIGRISGMSISFVGLTQAMQESAGMQELLASQQEKVAGIQEQLNAAIEQYGKDSAEAAALTKQFEEASRGMAFIQRNANFALSDTYYFMALIATELVGSLLPALANASGAMQKLRNVGSILSGTFTSLGTGVKNFGTTLTTGVIPATVEVTEKIKKIPPEFERMNQVITRTGGNAKMAFGSIIPVVTDAEGKFKSFGASIDQTSPYFTRLSREMDKTQTSSSRVVNAANAMRGGFTRLGGVIGAGIGGAGGTGLIGGMIAIAAATALYGTNAMGSRDAINDFGAAVGKTVPALRPVGDLLIGIAGSLGLTGETALQTKEHFDQAAQGFASYGDQWKTMVDKMISSNDLLESSLGRILDQLGKFSKDMQDNPLQTMIKTFAPGGAFIPFPEAPDTSAEGQQKSIAELVNQYNSGKITAKEFNEQLMKINDTVAAQSKAVITNSEKWDRNKFYQEQVRDQAANLQKQYNEMKATLMDQSKAQELVSFGMVKANNEMATQATGLKINSGYLKVYNEALGEQWYQQNLVMEGKQKQNLAYIQEQQNVLNLQGAYSELSDQITNQNALEVAYQTGVLETNLSLLEREKAISKVTGSLDAYNNAIVEGTVQELAFKEGINTQREALYGTVEAASNAQGQLKELTKEIKDQTITSAAYNQAYAETQLAIQNVVVEIAGAKGAWNAWTLAASQGTIANQSFVKGVLAANDALKKSYETLGQSSGALTQYNLLLKTGLPQGIAYAQTLADLSSAYSQQEVEIAKSSASLEYHQRALKESEAAEQGLRGAVVDASGAIVESAKNVAGVTKETAAAFVKGRDSVYGWWQELRNSQAAQQGAYLEMVQLAHTVGVVIPEGFRGGVAEMQRFVGLAKRMPQQIGEMRTELQGIFDGMIDGLSDAMRKGEDELDDAVDEMSKNLGIKFNKGVKEALEFQAGSDLFSDLSKEFGALFVGLGQNLDAKSMGDFKDQIQGKLDSVMGKVMDDLPDGPVKDRIKGSMQKIMDLFENADVKTPTGIVNFLGDLGMELMNVDSATNNFGETWENYINAISTGNLVEANKILQEMKMNAVAFTEVKMDPITGALYEVSRAADVVRQDIQDIADQYGDSVDQILAKADALKNIGFGAMNNLGGSESDPNSFINAPGMTDEDKKKIQGLGLSGGEEGDDAKIETAIKSLDQLKAKTDEVMAAMLSTVGTTMGQIATVTNTVFTQMMGTEADVFGKMITVATTSFTAIGEAAQQVVVGVTKHYNQAKSNADGVLAAMQQQAALRFKAAGESASGVTVGVTKNYNQAKSNADGVLAAMQEQAELRFAAIGDASEVVATDVKTNFDQAQSDGSAAMETLKTDGVNALEAVRKKAQEAAEQVAAIGGSAKAAKTQVDALASAINALKDKTVTITYRIRTVGSAPANAAQGTTGIHNFGQGGSIFDNETVITGESGDEIVAIYDKQGRLLKKEKVTDIKAFGLQKGQSIQVQPLEGQYARNFMQKYGNILNFASGQNWYYQNQNGKINTNIPGLAPDTTPGIGLGNNTQSFGDVTPFPTTGSTIGQPYSDGTDTVFTPDPYNRNLTASQYGKSYLGGNRWYDPLTNTYYTGTAPPVTGGDGTGGTGGSTGGGTQIVTTSDGRIVIKQGNGQQSIMIDGVEQLPNMNSTGSSTSNSFTDANGNNFNNQNDINNQSNVMGPNVNTNTVSNNESPTTSSTDVDKNFGNGKYYRSTNGVVETNMSPAEIQAMNEKFPFLHLDPSKGVGSGVGGSGAGEQVGKIWNMQLGDPNMGVQKAPFQYQNDPTGWHDYGLIPDPIFKETSSYKDPSSGMPGGGGDNSGGGNEWGFDIWDILRKILAAINLGSRTTVNVSGRNIMEVVQGQIMDGFTNFK